MREPTIVRGIVLSILAATAACTSEEVIDRPDDPEPTFQLDWDLEQDLESNVPVCPADQPDCDRLDEPDAVDEDGHPIEADDLVVGDVADEGVDDPSNLRGLSDPLTSTGKYRAWPNGRIPYVIARTSTGAYQINKTTRDRLSQAMTNWEALTEGRIRFRARKSTDKAYVVIKLGSPRVSPFVGYRAGQVQSMYLRNSEYITVIKHELGHVVGLHHEQRRTDRLDHIRVVASNIVNTTSCKYQFSVCTACKRIGTYNRTSVMHYRTTDLGNCRKGPVLLKKDGSWISHYWALNAKDLTTVAAMYAAPTPPAPYEPQPHPVDAFIPAQGTVMAAAGACVGVGAASVEAGAKLLGARCTGDGSQDWRTTRNGQLRVQHSLRCAEVVGDSRPGAHVEQVPCSAVNDAQKWTYSEMQLVHGTSGLCATARGGALELAACSGGAEQALAYDPTREALEAAGQCVTANVDTGAVSLAACDGSAGQRWFQARGGFVTRANTGRCMRVDGQTVGVGECSDDDTQRWGLRGAVRDARGGLCLQAGGESQPLALAACTRSAHQIWTFWSR